MGGGERDLGCNIDLINKAQFLDKGFPGIGAEVLFHLF